MKKILGLTLAAAIALTSQVNAKETKLKVSANAALTSNYVWRGISYTNTTPTAQVGVDYDNLFNVEGLHLNVWGSGIQEGSEIDTIIGYSTKMGSATVDFSLINYYYTQDYVGKVGTGGTTTFALGSYAEAYIDVAFENFGFTIYEEIGYGDTGGTENGYDGTTVVGYASFAGVDIYVGQRMTDVAGTDDSKFGQISYSFDSILIPSFTTTIFVAGNDQFKADQGESTSGITFSKDF